MNIIKAIFSGYSNLILHALTCKKSYTATKRYLICQRCPYRKVVFCGKCGCFISAKVFTEYPICKKDHKSIGGCPDIPPRW